MMKKLLLLGVLFSVLTAFSSPKAVINWSFTEYDFGSIERSKPVTIDFTFKNPGLIPLVITNVESSCGCTVPNYPKEPIGPGGEGKITVTYDAKVSGYFSKSIQVFTNTSDGVSHLYIKGEVQ